MIKASFHNLGISEAGVNLLPIKCAISTAKIRADYHCFMFLPQITQVLLIYIFYFPCQSAVKFFFSLIKNFCWIFKGREKPTL
jgi:hypothetical protein